MISSKRVQLFDTLRNFFSGTLTPLTEVILMLVLIKRFEASTIEKTLLASLMKSCFLLAIPISIFLLRKNIKISNILSGIFFTSAIATFFVIWTKNVWIFIGLAMIIAFSKNGINSLTPNIYTAYKKNRTLRYAFSNIFFALGSIGFTFLLDRSLFDPSLFKQLAKSSLNVSKNIESSTFVIGSLALCLAALSSYFIPITKQQYDKKNLSLKAIVTILKKDRFFCWMLIAWTFLGFSKMWLLPYKTNILTEDHFGFSYDSKVTLMILVVVPQITYILFCLPLGRLFDRYHFISIRLLVNFFLMMYYIFFFLGENIHFHILGAFFLGLSNVGGNIAWNMWVNKMVPPKDITLYMNIHVGFTGVRMIFAPLLGLTSLYHLGVQTCAAISIAMLSISVVIFLFLQATGKKRFVH